MTRRRISVSLIAAAATTLALVSPAQAAEAEPGSAALSSNLSSSAPADTEDPAAEDEAPGEGDEDDDVNTNLGSFEVTDDVELTFAVLEAIMAVGTAATTGLITYVRLVPGADAQVRDFLAQFGIQP